MSEEFRIYTSHSYTLDDLRMLKECVDANSGLYQALVAFKDGSRRSLTDIFHLFLPIAEQMAKNIPVIEQHIEKMKLPEGCGFNWVSQFNHEISTPGPDITW